MEKLIFKYLAGKTDASENKRVREWILESKENLEYFAKIKNTYVIAQMPDIKASDEDASAFISLIKKRDARKKFFLKAKVLSASAAAIIVIIISFTIFQSRLNSYKNEIRYLSSQDISLLENSTPNGVKGKVILPDKSIVLLNSGSSITYPSKFTGKTRNITFKGEGYFEIKKNADFPMNISLENGLSVVVKGTSFNLSSYSNDNTVSILLLSGKVEMLDKNSNVFVNLEPNQKIYVDKKTNKISIQTPEDTLSTVGWKSGLLIFEDTEMSEIIKKLERWYGVKIVVNDSSILSKNLTAKFREESISQVLELMRRISLVNYNIKDNIVTLESCRESYRNF